MFERCFDEGRYQQAAGIALETRRIDLLERAILESVSDRQTYISIPEFLITFEAWAKLAQKWLVCVPLRIHLEANYLRVNDVSDNIIIINCATGSKRELCSAKKEALWANGAPYDLIKNTGVYIHVYTCTCRWKDVCSQSVRPSQDC